MILYYCHHVDGRNHLFGRSIKSNRINLQRSLIGMRKNWYVLLLAALWLLCALIPTAIAEDAINVVGNFELSLNEEPSVATDGLEVLSVDDVPELDPEFSIVLEGADDGQQSGADDPLALSLDDGISLPDGIPENREAAQANDGESGAGFVIDEYGVLVEYNGPGGAVTIPRMVYAIGGGAFYGCDTLTSLTVPGNVKIIGYNAFNGCRRLESVTLEAGVEIIEENAFQDCSLLKTLTMADGLKAVRGGAFIGTCIEELIFPDSVTELWGSATFDRWHRNPLTGSLKKVHWPAGVVDINNDQFHGFYALTEIQIPANLESIGEWAFEGCTGLDSFDIPATVMSIGKGAFNGCDGLTSITIPDGVPEIGTMTFSNCDRLTSIVVPGSVKTVGDSAFENCDRLASVTLEAGVEVIGVEAFKDCDSLKTLTMANGLKAVESGAFIGTRIEELIFPDSVTELAGGATFGGYYNGPLCESLKKVRWPAGVRDIHEDQFHGFTALTEIQLPANLKTIGNGAFCNCTNLKKINIPATVNSIGEDAFWSCNSLTAITIPNGVPYIGDNTFFNCDSLTSIVVPGSVKTIGDSAFFSCDRLASVTLEAGVEKLDADAFRGCDALKSLTMADGLKTVKTGAFIGCRIEELIFPDSVTELAAGATHHGLEEALSESLKKVRWPAGVKEIHDNQFDGFSVLTEIQIPANLETIGSYAFYNCTRLKAIDIPATVSSIGEGAFYNCDGLTAVTIPNGVPEIGDSTFCDCDKLTSMVVPGSVKTVGESAFEGCDRLGSVTLEEGVEMLDVGAFRNCESLKTLTMANGLETLKEGVFFNTPLKALNFPDSVTELGKDAISGDPLRKSLKSVHWPAGITEIQEEQFRYFTALKDVFIPKGVTTIGENAFLNCTKLSIVNISSTVKKIADDSFERCPELEIWAPAGSAAEKFARSNGIPVVHTDEKGREILPKSVKLNKTKATLVVGGKLTLKATVTPSKATPRFTWTSSNKKVATVSKNGVVKALKKGTATITVKTSNGKKATCKITVPAAPTGVTLNKTKATLKVGGKLTLKPKLKGAGAKTTFTWTSSNKKIATVSSSGVVKALKKGTVTITVKTANGKKATCKITVK